MHLPAIIPFEAYVSQGSVIDPETGTLRAVYGPTSTFKALHARVESIEALKIMGFALHSRARELASNLNGGKSSTFDSSDTSKS